MGLFGNKNKEIANQFQSITANGHQLSEADFLDQMNMIFVAVSQCDDYSTNDRLRIYDLLTQVSNCSASSRRKYFKKIARLL